MATERPPGLREPGSIPYLMQAREEGRARRTQIAQVLPPRIGVLKSLTVLKLDSNALTALPPEVGQLVRLEVLDLHSNLINNVPIQLGACAKLHTVNLLDNPLSVRWSGASRTASRA